MNNVIVIIPARGGSKGIPRKNIRPLAGKPLISYCIKNALEAFDGSYVVVSSDDDEILNAAAVFGAQTHKRDPRLADDVTTLDPVIFSALSHAELTTGRRFEYVVTMQPTSPLLSVESLKNAISQLIELSLDTLISAVDDTHLTWSKEDSYFKPNYLRRVNRQMLPKTFKESGGFLMSRRKCVSELSRIGNKIQLFELSKEEGIDIDDLLDWNLCEFLLNRKKIVIVVRGDSVIGLGHVYNCLNVADEILEHDIHFLIPKNNPLALQRIKQSNYRVMAQTKDDLLDDIAQLKPDLVINDMLDTDESYISGLKKRGFYVFNFEDLGPGAAYADVVVNAMYPEQESLKNHYFGPKYFCIKSEFLHQGIRPFNDKVEEIVIAFGGVDPSDLTRMTLEAIYESTIQKGIRLRVILGLGYTDKVGIYRDFPKAIIHENVSNMAQLLSTADLGITSAGRTTFELACLGIPAIVLCQNERETTHLFATRKYGFCNLGLGSHIKSDFLGHEIDKLIFDNHRRMSMRNKMIESDIRRGKERVIELIKKTVKHA